MKVTYNRRDVHELLTIVEAVKDNLMNIIEGHEKKIEARKQELRRSFFTRVFCDSMWDSEIMTHRITLSGRKDCLRAVCNILKATNLFLFNTTPATFTLSDKEVEILARFFEGD